MPYQSGVASVTSTATLIATVGASVPENDGVRIKNVGSATVYVGGSAVTTASGFPVASTDGVVNIPSTGAVRRCTASRPRRVLSM
jgi:hypothetical protein